MPKETEVDGASIPEVFWSFIGGPFSGKYLKASVVHDHFCESRTRTAHDTHRNFYYGMKAEGVPNWRAKAMYWAVSTFGPNWQLKKRVVQRQACDQLGNCTITPEIITMIVASPSIDLEDPQALAIALGKFTSVARTLKTTDGEVLDVIAPGPIEASLQSIEESAALTRQIIETKAYSVDPDALGILSSSETKTFDALETWPGNELPSFSEAPVLNPTYSPSDRSDVEGGFQLERGSIDVLERNLDLSPKTFVLPKGSQFQSLPK